MVMVMVVVVLVIVIVSMVMLMIMVMMMVVIVVVVVGLHRAEPTSGLPQRGSPNRDQDKERDSAPQDIRMKRRRHNEFQLVLPPEQDVHSTQGTTDADHEELLDV